MAAGFCGKVFCCFGRCRVVAKCGFALVLWVGSVRLCNVARVEIDPPSLVACATNCLQFSSPEGKPFCKASFALHNKAIGRKYEVVVTIYLSALYSLVKVVFAMYARRKEGFPLGGRKLQAVCRVSD